MNKKIKGYELYKMIAEKKLKNPVKLIDNKEEIWNFDGNNFIPITSRSVNDVIFAEMEFVILDLGTFGVEILEDEEDNDISSLNAFKLMEAPYMAKCLDKNSHEEFMELLKQSEVEIVHKIGELLEKVNKLDKKINKED